jgi:PAS domain-containing protein
MQIRAGELACRVWVGGKDASLHRGQFSGLNSATPLTSASGRFQGWILMHNGVTEDVRVKLREQKLAETAEAQADELKSGGEEPQKNERKISEILGSIRNGFFSLDSDWKFDHVNQRAAQNVGHQPSDILGKNIWEVFPSSR